MILGEDTALISLRTGCRHNGQFTTGGALSGRVKVNPPLQTRHSPEHGSYS